MKRRGLSQYIGLCYRLKDPAFLTRQRIGLFFSPKY